MGDGSKEMRGKEESRQGNVNNYWENIKKREPDKREEKEKKVVSR